MQNVPMSIGPGDPGRSVEAGLAPAAGPAEIWAKDEIRRACARRDIAHVYKMLNAAGVSQRRLTAATGRAQNETSEILCCGRVACPMGVLKRIADGLGIPRGWWGPAHTIPADDGSAPRAGAPSGGA